MPAPGYTYLTLSQARAQLTQRLEDVAPEGGLVFWTAQELNDLIIEAIRTWQATTSYYKQRTTFNISPGGGIDGSSFYDLNFVSGVLSFKFTDADLIRMTLAALLEPPLTADWVGTGQFAFPAVVQALQNRINRWLTDTGADVTRQVQMTTAASPTASRIFLPEGVLDVRRAAWIIFSPAVNAWMAQPGISIPSNSGWMTAGGMNIPLGTGFTAIPGVGIPPNTEWVGAPSQNPGGWMGTSSKLFNPQAWLAAFPDLKLLAGDLLAQWNIQTINIAGKDVTITPRTATSRSLTVNPMVQPTRSVDIIIQQPQVAIGAIATPAPIFPDIEGWIHKYPSLRLILSDWVRAGVNIQMAMKSLAIATQTTQVLNIDPQAQYHTLWRDDEFAMQAFHNPGSLTPGLPLVWGKFIMPPVGIDVYPIPSEPAALETLVVQAGPNIGTTPAAVVNSPVTLTIPEDFTWGVRFGALSDLLSGDGQMRDPDRAAYCEKRYQESVELYKINPTLVMSMINGVQVWSGSVFEMDAFLANWQAVPGTPTFVGMAGRNLVAFGPTPDSTFSVTMDIAADIPLPAADSDFIQVDRGALDCLLDYAQHLASFKMHGTEFKATEALRQNFLKQAELENSRIRRSNFYKSAFELPAVRQQQEVPRT